MVGLALHTSTPELGLALIEPAGTLRHQVWDLGRDLSSHLHEKLIEFILPYRWQDLHWLAVCQGPGGFTGTRMGVVTARTLAQQLEIPLFGISALAAVAVLKSTRDTPTEIVVTMPAKREAVYGAIYQPDSDGWLEPLVADIVMPETAWLALLADRSPGQIVTVSAGESLGTSVTGVLKLAQIQWQRGLRPHWREVLPFYGQAPVDLPGAAPIHS